MKRIIEPELMDTEEQARAYSEANYKESHEAYPKMFAERFPNRPKKAVVLDLGCGPCDVTIRFARRNPGYLFQGVDGSAAMLKFGRQAIRKHNLSRRVKLIRRLIPAKSFLKRGYDVVLSTNFLHHLHDPAGLWKTISQASRRGTLVFVTDLRRPTSKSRATGVVRKYASEAAQVLKRDFLNSLCAAFTPSEVRKQLKEHDLNWLKVEAVGDRHLIVFGAMGRNEKSGG